MFLGKEYNNEGAAILNALSLYVVVFDLGNCSRFADEDFGSIRSRVIRTVQSALDNKS